MTEKKLNDKSKRQLELNRLQRYWSNLNLSMRILEPGLKQRWQKIALLTGFSLLAAIMVFPRPQALHFDYEVGDIAERDIKASSDFLVEDKESTAKRQQEQLNDSPLIFDLDERIGPAINARLHQAFEFMRQNVQELKKAAPADVPAPAGSQAAAPSPAEAETKISFSKIYKALLDKKPEFDRMLGVTLPNNIFYLLARNYFSAQWEDVISQQVNQVISQGVFSDQNLPPTDLHRPIVIRRLPSWQEKEENNAGRFLELNDAKKKVNLYCREAAEDLPSGQRWAICEVAQSLIVSNVSLNRAETEQRKLTRLQNLRPVFFQIKKGEMLVREGEKITPTQLIKLQALQKDRPQGWWFWRFLGTWGLIALVAAFSYKLIRLNAKKRPAQPEGINLYCRNSVGHYPFGCGHGNFWRGPDASGSPGRQKFSFLSAGGSGSHPDTILHRCGNRSAHGLYSRHAHLPAGGQALPVLPLFFLERSGGSLGRLFFPHPLGFHPYQLICRSR